MLGIKKKCPAGHLTWNVNFGITLENCWKITSKTFHRNTYFCLFREFVYNVCTRFFLKVLLNQSNILSNMLDEISGRCWMNVVVCTCHPACFIQYASPFILSFKVKPKMLLPVILSELVSSDNEKPRQVKREIG